jgi:hypothetical protein
MLPSIQPPCIPSNFMIAVLFIRSIHRFSHSSRHQSVMVTVTMMALWQIVLMTMSMSTSSLVLESPKIRAMTSSDFGIPSRGSRPLSSPLISQPPLLLQRSSTALSMVRTRGLEKTRQGATPTGRFFPCHVLIATDPPLRRSTMSGSSFM